MTINRRLEKIEGQIPEPRPWKYNVDDLAVGWGPMSDEEREILTPLTLDEVFKLIDHLSQMPLDELEKLAEISAQARYILAARVIFSRRFAGYDDQPPT